MAHGQGRGPAWTVEEDAAIRRAVRANRERGFTALERAGAGDGWRVVRTARLADVARAIGRSVDAVRKRAQRIGAQSRWRRQRDQDGRRKSNQAGGPEVPDGENDKSRAVDAKEATIQGEWQRRRD